MLDAKGKIAFGAFACSTVALGTCELGAVCFRRLETRLLSYSSCEDRKPTEMRVHAYIYIYSCAPVHIHAQTQMEVDRKAVRVLSGSDQHVAITNSITISITIAILFVHV